MKRERKCECCGEKPPKPSRLRRCSQCDRMYCLGCVGGDRWCGKCWSGGYEWTIGKGMPGERW